VKILGVGAYAPERKLTNADLEQMVETSDEWIVSRTGIHTRHIVAPGQSDVDLAEAAARQAVRASGLAGDQIDVIICATFTVPRFVPSAAADIQQRLGIHEDIIAFDLNAACSGFVFALITAERLLRPGQRALVIGSEALSTVTDYQDRSTCVLFGDGAGAVVIEQDGAPFWSKTLVRGGDDALKSDPYIRMQGGEVFKFATRALNQTARDVIAQAGWQPQEVDCFICHQANLRILQNAAKQLEVGMDRFFVNVDEYGNTSAASVPLALAEAYQAGRLHNGDKVVLAGFGGGLTAGAAAFVWQGR
jgi:3-oxoacyl-[acyl-carrier-protein] synthase-3